MQKRTIAALAALAAIVGILVWWRSQPQNSQTPAPVAVSEPTQKPHAPSLPSAERPAASAPRPADSAHADSSLWRVPVGNSPVRGPKDALVTLVVFGDFQCPFCKRAEESFDQLRKEMGNKVRFVWKDRPLPFHARAEAAAELAREARKQKGEEGFWKAHDLLFENQGAFADADLEKMAKSLGLNAGRVRDAVAHDTYAKDIDADDLLADQLRSEGTPQVFINGRRLVGAQPIETYRSTILEELAKAEIAVKGGTPPEKVYDKLMASVQEPPPFEGPEKKSVTASTKNRPSKGKADAKIVFQIFSDFECPYCSRVEETLGQVEEAFGGRIKIVWRNMPLQSHELAMPAAEAAMEAFAQKGSEGFWKYHDRLFSQQRIPGGLARAALEKYAEEQGLDLPRFRAALDQHIHKADIEADMKVGQDAGIEGTPSFVVGPYFVAGAVGFHEFAKVIHLAIRDSRAAGAASPNR